MAVSVHATEPNSRLPCPAQLETHATRNPPRHGGTRMHMPCACMQTCGYARVTHVYAHTCFYVICNCGMHTCTYVHTCLYNNLFQPVDHVVLHDAYAHRNTQTTGHVETSGDQQHALHVHFIIGLCKAYCNTTQHTTLSVLAACLSTEPAVSGDAAKDHRLPDGVGTDGVFTEGRQIPSILQHAVVCVHMLPHLVIC